MFVFVVVFVFCFCFVFVVVVVIALSFVWFVCHCVPCRLYRKKCIFVHSMEVVSVDSVVLIVCWQVLNYGLGGVYGPHEDSVVIKLLALFPAGHYTTAHLRLLCLHNCLPVTHISKQHLVSIILYL